MSATETYRKEGRVVRFERSSEGTHLVRIEECGVAIERGDELEIFTASDDQSTPPVAEPAVRNVERVAAELDARIAAPLVIERLIVSEGGASHEFTTTGHSLRWSESSERIHLALAHPAARVRALVDLAAFDALHEAEEVARALARLVVTECAPLARVRLHPRVTAALLPSLALFPSLGIGQATHPATPLDGKGRPIDFCAPPANGIWPNWYRPSYRIRATRMPFHLDLAGEAATIAADTPQAIALTAPVELRNEHLRLRALVVADGVAAERVIDIAISEWPQRLLAIGERAAWYPYAAGTWGRDALLTL